MRSLVCADPKCVHDLDSHYDKRDNCLVMRCNCPAFATLEAGALIRRPSLSFVIDVAAATKSWPCLACGHPEEAHTERSALYRGQCKRADCGCSDYFPDRS